MNDDTEKIGKISKAQKNNKKSININKAKNFEKSKINKNSINKDNKNNQIVKINPKKIINVLKI